MMRWKRGPRRSEEVFMCFGRRYDAVEEGATKTTKNHEDARRNEEVFMFLRLRVLSRAASESCE